MVCGYPAGRLKPSARPPRPLQLSWHARPVGVRLRPADPTAPRPNHPAHPIRFWHASVIPRPGHGQPRVAQHILAAQVRLPRASTGHTCSTRPLRTPINSSARLTAVQTWMG